MLESFATVRGSVQIICRSSKLCDKLFSEAMAHLLSSSMFEPDTALCIEDGENVIRQYGANKTDYPVCTYLYSIGSSDSLMEKMRYSVLPYFVDAFRIFADSKDILGCADFDIETFRYNSITDLVGGRSSRVFAAAGQPARSPRSATRAR